AVLIRAHDFNRFLRADGLEETLLALNRALRAFGVAEHYDLAGVVQDRGQMIAGHAATLAVVGRDEADVVVALQPRVDDDDRNAAALRVRDRRRQRRVLARGAAGTRDA